MSHTPTRRAARTALDLQAVRVDLEHEFGEQTFRRGVDYVAGKRIRILFAQRDDEQVWHLLASVRGTAPEPYTTSVEMEFYEYGVDIIGTQCNCPVGHQCKHAAGLAYQWATMQPERSGTLTGQPAAPIGEPLPPAAAPAPVAAASPRAAIDSEATSTKSVALPTELSMWLRAGISSASHGVSKDVEAAASKPAPDHVAYLITARGELTLARARRLKTGEMRLSAQNPSLAWVTHNQRPPSYVMPEDEPILRMMAATIGMYASRPVLALEGATGTTLLDLALATRRLWLAPDAVAERASGARAHTTTDASTLGAPFSMGESLAATLAWCEVNTAQGPRMAIRAKAGADAEAPALPIITLTPPLAIDAEQRQLRPLIGAVSPETLARLVALPPLNANDATAWAFVDDALRELPDFDAIPRCPTIVPPDATGGEPALPVPQAVLRFALVEFDTAMGWGRKARVQSHVFPAAQLLFRYPDGRVVAFRRSGFDHAIEQRRVGSELVGQWLRNVRAEAQWEMRLPNLLYSAARIEPALAYAYDVPALFESLWGLPDHDWSQHGAMVLAQAQMSGFAIEIEDGFPISMTDIPEPTLELAPGTEAGWYRLSFGVDIDGKRVDLAPALAKLIGAQKDPEQWLAELPTVEHVLLSVPVPDRVKGAHVVRLGGERVAAILRPVFDWFHGGGVHPISELQAALLPELPNATVQYFGRDHPRWLAMRERLRDGAQLTAVVAAPGFAATLRPYQNHGLSWLTHLHELGMGGVLADDMGLGKTVQTLAHLHRLQRRQRAEEAPARTKSGARAKAKAAAAPTTTAVDGETARKPSLIIAPTSVLGNWQREAERFAPTLKVHRHHGIARASAATAFAGADVVLTSYPLLQRDAGLLASIEWDVVVFDEAQTLKNAKAKTYVSAQALRAQQRLALTGTPMENHLGELWAIFNVLVPGLLGSLENFNTTFRHPIEQRADGERMQRLKARVRAFMLRRRRDQVLGELPPKTEYTRWIELEPAQGDLYEALRTAVHEDIRRVIETKGLKQSTVHILDALLKLRQACCDPRLVKLPGKSALAMKAGSAKLDWLATHVPELLEDGRKLLIFSQFTSMLALIAEQLNALHIPFVLLTGDTTDRDTPINEFQSGKVSVFLLSLKAGGVGLNLTAADTVIHYDPWWNPAVEAQATARAHRMGQDKPVIVTKLVAKGTLEEHMLAMLNRKRDLAAALLDGGGNALTGLTLADVDELLSPLAG
ncbi:MAG: DEAD/DEAH box helicase [Burkholderiales bacterium]|nr:DEAD/DEAH box helicase [Burkholderiales bacterium]